MCGCEYINEKIVAPFNNLLFELEIINEIDVLFHINAIILSHPHNNICVTKKQLSTQRVETCSFEICCPYRQKHHFLSRWTTFVVYKDTCIKK